jgi:mannose-6-phosphate isomerase-like protein (cupin superfamily)
MNKHITKTWIVTALIFVTMNVFAQEVRRAIPGEIETYIDRFGIERVSKNQNGWAHYYIPRGMGDTLTVKMSCVYNGIQTHTPHTHHEDESFYVIKGPVRFHINNEERLMNTGDFAYTPSGTSHNIQRTNEVDTVKYLVIKRETLRAVDKPYITGRPYTLDDCYSFLTKNPTWLRTAEPASVCLLDKNFAANFQVMIERMTDNSKIYNRQNTNDRGQVAIYVIEGEANVTLDGMQAQINTDNTFYCPKNSTFSLQKRGNAPLVFLAITTE